MSRKRCKDDGEVGNRGREKEKKERERERGEEKAKTECEEEKLIYDNKTRVHLFRSLRKRTLFSDFIFKLGLLVF